MRDEERCPNTKICGHGNNGEVGAECVHQRTQKMNLRGDGNPLCGRAVDE
eukprot:GAFH01002085.1.p8 GENE.GAFH01002085.1~~GAFH01002085.1.p8  ORF type:complete len:50 (-),score=4.17 GAFH01002085.1:955-1104(-)